ncbi:ComEA family DNA-binding protein [Blastococcus xanthinilyticus]|uniref:Competence protein ComEA n=1 Tax=Blastococcus xanthinilyticus TaxID=1564164 RepID=A0A5S5CWR6_9ACTN|nr:ComEA family DNA-binding protein [Blastococcus xanthinilyticus]TYP87534.1 competence protein ComEA [Blastococcus xanthinilyticus]
MRLTSRRDDADIIRARLRALLADRDGSGGWLPEQEADEEVPEPVGWADDRGDVPADPGDGLPGEVGRHRAPGTALRWRAGPSGVRALWVAAVVAVAVVLTWTWLDRPRVEPVSPPAATSPAATSPAATSPVATSPAAGSTTPAPGSPAPATPSAEAAAGSAPVVVSVVGRVARPGLVSLRAGARVADAVAAAGGLLPDADPASVNLAALVADGQQIAVGVPGAGTGVAPDGAASPGAPPGPVDLNAAGAADLDALPGIGPVLAQRIVEHRTRNGPFRSVDELDDVPGIGPTIAAELADLVTV